MRLILAFLLAGCAAASSGGGSAEVIPNTPPAPNGVAAIIIIFGATYCKPCKQMVPQIQDELDRLAKSTRGQIEFRLYVTDAKTQAEADNYARNTLHVDAKAFPDPNGKVLRTMNIGTFIPAGIVLEAGGKVVDRFPAGMTFVPKTIVDTAAKLAK